MKTSDKQELDHLFGTIRQLINNWCDRRCLKALRAILRGYPMTSPLSDGWGELLLALLDVRAFAGGELIQPERKMVDDCIRTIEQRMPAIRRRIEPENT
jgi:hypothetical protein